MMNPSTTLIPKDYLKSAMCNDKWGGEQPEFSSFKKNAIIQISKENAYNVALGTELKNALPVEPTRVLLPDGSPLLSDAQFGQVHSHYQFKYKIEEKHNDNWEKRATHVFNVISKTLQLTLLSRVSQHIMDRDPAACWAAFLSLGGIRNAAIAVSARNGLANTNFTGCSVTVIAACLDETYERVNENSTDPVSDSEKKAMLISKVTQSDTKKIFTFIINTISLKTVAPIPGYEEVKILLLTAESSHYQNVDPHTIVKATFNSFGMKDNNSKDHSAKSSNSNTSCPYCHQQGHTKEDCPRFLFCDGCDKIHSKYWKGCPSENFSDKQKPNNKYPTKKQDKTETSSSFQQQKKRPIDESFNKGKKPDGGASNKKKNSANAAKEDPNAVNIAEALSTMSDSMLSLTSAVTTLTGQQAKTVKDMERNQIKTAKLSSRMDQVDHRANSASVTKTPNQFVRKVNGGIIYQDASYPQKGIRYQDDEESDESNA
jgi:hypothetical protein